MPRMSRTITAPTIERQLRSLVPHLTAAARRAHLEGLDELAQVLFSAAATAAAWAAMLEAERHWPAPKLDDPPGGPPEGPTAA
jgi:hypothetical protein